jgi:hypothetical protein
VLLVGQSFPEHFFAVLKAEDTLLGLRQFSLELGHLGLERCDFSLLSDDADVTLNDSLVNWLTSVDCRVGVTSIISRPRCSTPVATTLYRAKRRTFNQIHLIYLQPHKSQIINKKNRTVVDARGSLEDFLALLHVPRSGLAAFGDHNYRVGRVVGAFLHGPLTGTGTRGGAVGTILGVFIASRVRTKIKIIAVQRSHFFATIKLNKRDHLEEVDPELTPDELWITRLGGPPMRSKGLRPSERLLPEAEWAVITDPAQEWLLMEPVLRLALSKQREDAKILARTLCLLPSRTEIRNKDVGHESISICPGFGH